MKSKTGAKKANSPHNNSNNLYHKFSDSLFKVARLPM